MGSKSSYKTVEPHPAFCWDCDECGVENFGRVLPYFPTQEEENELVMEHGFDPGSVEPGAPVMMPSTVKCKACGSLFSLEVD